MLCELSTIFREHGESYMAVNAGQTFRKGDEYFKVYNNENAVKSNKVIRISFLEPKLIYHKTDGKQKWELTKSDMIKIIDILKRKSKFDKESTVFQYGIIGFNLEYFGLTTEETKQITEYKGAGHPLPYNLKMPNYLSLF